MDSREAAQQLIDQLAGEIDLEGLAFDEDGVIDLKLGEALRLSLAVDPAENALVLCAFLGGPADRGSADLLRRLLRENASFHAERGPTFAADPATGHLVLHQRLDLRGLGYQRFKDALQRITEEQERWAPEVQHRGGGTTPAEPLATDFSAIRG